MTGGADYDVLIVGAGPVGVALAVMLGQQGVRVLVAEKAMEIYPLPRAAHVDHEIVRLFQSMGLADQIMATSRTTTQYDFLTAAGEVLMRFDLGGVKTPSGWPASNMIHQPSIEAALRAALAQCPAARLKSGWTLEHFTDHDDGVIAHFTTADGPQQVRARYLIGCDGARSTVRAQSQINFLDLAFDEPWLVVDTIVHDESRLPTKNLQICDPARPTTCVLMGSGRHRWEFMLKPGEEPDDVTRADFVTALLAPWKVEGAVSIERMAVYRFHALIAQDWRKGRILLAGDAAHQMPPFAGQGLCSGLRDAANLAGKFGTIIRDGASDRLLDSYQMEREPNVRGIIAMAMMMGQTVCILDPEKAAQRDQMMLAARAAGGGPPPAPAYPPIDAGCILAGTAAAGTYFPQPWAQGPAGPIRLDDVLGPGAWLIGRAAAALPPNDRITSLSLDDPRLAPFKPELSHWLDAHSADAVMVRPDRYIFGTGASDKLSSEWRSSQFGS
jgi:3-(3-hydroxy-phenyl)propionate hydroxylase